jgi:hypothetical protein
MKAHVINKLGLLACTFGLIACQPIPKLAGNAQVSPKYDRMAANIQHLFTQEPNSSCNIDFTIARKRQTQNQLVQNKRYNPMTLKLIVKATGTCHQRTIDQSWYQEIQILNDSSDLSQIDQSDRVLWQSIEFKAIDQIRNWLKQLSTQN